MNEKDTLLAWGDAADVAAKGRGEYKLALSKFEKVRALVICMAEWQCCVLLGENQRFNR